MAGKSNNTNGATKWVYQSHSEDFMNEQERKDAFRKSVIVNRPPRTHNKANNVASHSKTPASYFTMQWVNSDRVIRNAAVNGTKQPIITSSGRTFTC